MQKSALVNPMRSLLQNQMTIMSIANVDIVLSYMLSTKAFRLLILSAGQAKGLVWVLYRTTYTYLLLIRASLAHMMRLYGTLLRYSISYLLVCHSVSYVFTPGCHILSAYVLIRSMLQKLHASDICSRTDLQSSLLSTGTSCADLFSEQIL